MLPVSTTNTGRCAVLRPISAHPSRAAFAAALALAIASAVCAEALAATPIPPPSQSAAAKPGAATADAMATPDFFSFAERYGPAVVHVIARSADDPAAPAEQEAIDADDPFYPFFRRTPQPPAENDAHAPRAMTGVGSGFIVSPDGLVLTTAHVVDNAQDVKVQLTDKREFKAEVVAVDPQSDVAVLQIDGHDLPSVRLGDSSKVRAGEPVLSIGSPDSFQNTVTTGIVSATSRTLPDGRAFAFFQTNVAVNPDNSGGPLFNRAGEVIGIDVQIYTDGDRYQGLTFAIPIEAANRFREQLQEARKSTPAGGANAADAANGGNPGTTHTFGMDVEDVSPGLAAALGLPHAGGALVDAVEAGSPGALAGVKPGDVIVQVGDKPIDRGATLATQLAAVPPATQTPLKVIRNRRPMLTGFSNAAGAVKVKDKRPAAQPVQTADTADATDAPDPTAVAAVTPDADAGNGAAPAVAPVAAQPAAAPKPHGSADRLGLIAHTLSEDEKRSTGLPLGLMVDASNGPAARAGVRAGDVVLSLNDTLIESREQANVLEAKATKKVALLIQRNNARSFVDVQLK
jgi:serine protease Do